MPAEYRRASPILGLNAGSAGPGAFLAADSGVFADSVDAEGAAGAGSSFEASTAFATGVKETTFCELLARKCSHRNPAAASTSAAVTARMSEARPLMLPLK